MLVLILPARAGHAWVRAEIEILGSFAQASELLV
jgi:hypothetical protein